MAAGMLAVGFSLSVAGCDGRAARPAPMGRQQPRRARGPKPFNRAPIDAVDPFDPFDSSPHHRNGGYPDVITCPPAALPRE